MTKPLLSICINTRNRASFLIETLDSMTAQLDDRVEIVVVDGGSTDSTPEVLSEYSARFPSIRSFRPDGDVGIDEGYDLAVQKAAGQYCWLMTDDDLVVEGSIQQILAKIVNDIDLLILNIALFTKDLSMDLHQNLFPNKFDSVYSEDTFEEFMYLHGVGLSYIGCVVIKRSIWFESCRKQYYGSYFVHVGVICTSTQINSIYFIHTPLILYRSANSSWTARSFEIWHFLWPELIWSCARISDEVKYQIAPNRVWNQWRVLIKSRAMGEYNRHVFAKFLKSKSFGLVRFRNYLIAVMPRTVVSLFLIFLCGLFKRKGLYTLYNLKMSSARSESADVLTKLLGIRFPD